MSEPMTAAPIESSSGPAGGSAQVLFIAGWGRSGSTLLDRMLGQLPGVASVGELRDIWLRGVSEGRLCGCHEPFSTCPFWRAVGQEAFGGWHRLDLDRIARLRATVDRPWNFPLLLAPRWLGRLRPSLAAQASEYAELLGRLYAAIGTVSGARVVVDSSKIPTYALLVRRAGVPVRVVHLVRDSRGAMHSWRKQVRRPDAPETADYMLRYGVAAGSLRYLLYNLCSQLLPLAGLASMRLRYEDLVREPAAGLARVAAHLGTAVPQEVARRLDGGSMRLAPNHTVDGNPMRFTVGEMPIRLDDAWRRSLPRREAAAVTVLTAPLLAAYGYLAGASWQPEEASCRR